MSGNTPYGPSVIERLIRDIQTNRGAANDLISLIIEQIPPQPSLASILVAAANDNQTRILSNGNPVTLDANGIARDLMGHSYSDTLNFNRLTVVRNALNPRQVDIGGGALMNADYVVASDGTGTHTALYGANGALAAAITTGVNAFIWICTTHAEPAVIAAQPLDSLVANQVITIGSGGAYRPVLPVGASIDLHGTTASPGGGCRVVYQSVQFSINSTFTANLFSFQQSGGSPAVELENVNFAGAGTWRTIVVNGPGQTGSVHLTRCTGSVNAITTCGGTGSTWNNLGFNGNTGSGSVLSVRGCKGLSVQHLIFRVADTHVEPAVRNEFTANDLTISDYAFQMTFEQKVLVAGNMITAPFNGRLLQFGTTGSSGIGHCVVTGNDIDMSGGGNSSRAVYCNNFAAGTGLDFTVIGNGLWGPGGTSAAIEIGSSTGPIVLEPNGFYNWGSNLTGSGAKTTLSGPVIFSSLPSGLGHNILSTTHGDSAAAAVARGGMIVGNSTPAWGLVSIGAAGSLWLSNGTDPSWATNVPLAGYFRAGSASAPSNTTAGDINGLRLFIGADAALLSGLIAQIAGALGISAANALRFYNGANSHYAGFKTGSMSADQTWTLPIADGSSGQAIVTDGAGTLSFGTAGGGTTTVYSAGIATVTFLTDSGLSTWTNQSAAATELLGSTQFREKLNLAGSSTARLIVNRSTAGFAGSTLAVQYSPDQTTWTYLDGSSGPSVAIDGTGLVVSTDITVAAGAQGDVYLRIVGAGGNAATSPVFGSVTVAIAGAGTNLAPVDATYITRTSNSVLTKEIVRPQLFNYFHETPPTSANAMDDEFDDSTGMSGTLNGLNARWAWRNQGATTATFPKQGYVTLTNPASSTDNWHIIEQALPAGDWTFEASVSLESAILSSGLAHGGIVVIDGVNGDLYAFDLDLRPTNAIQCEIARWNSVTSYNSNPVALFAWPHSHGYQRVSYASGTSTLSFWISANGISWVRVGSFVDAVVVTKIGLGVDETNNTGLTKLHCDYFRRTA